MVRRLLKMLFCKHEFEFDSNEYGDPIMYGGFHRSNWYCTKCGMWQGREYLVPDDKPRIQSYLLCIQK